MSLLIQFLELLPQIIRQWSGITTEEISSICVLTSTASVGGNCHRNRLQQDSSFRMNDFYRDAASIVVNNGSCQNTSVYPNSTK